MTSPGTSAARLREGLAADGGAMRMYQTEALFHARVDWTCLLLDVVDEAAGPATAERIAGAICGRLAGAAAAEAAERARQFEEETQRMMAAAPAARLARLRYTRDNGGLLSPAARAELEELERDGR
jgi:hypothetical protein